MKTPFVLAQISDCHLLHDSDGRHCGANVLQNLAHVLNDIEQNVKPDCIVFTGDLTQDHSETSYQHFADAIKQSKISAPVYYLAGNHDEPALLTHYLSGSRFNADKVFTHDLWQIILLNSKSKTPSGYISKKTLHWLHNIIDPTKFQIIMMHHHPIDVGYFIDKHGLINKDEFWQNVARHETIKAIACGHVHQGRTLLFEKALNPMPVYTCPATSIQFDPQSETVSCNGQGPGFRLFTLKPNGEIKSRLRFCNNELTKEENA